MANVRWPRNRMVAQVESLEGRTLLSISSRYNVVYERAGGQVEHLDVYEPPGPVPPGGRPVLVAIHGGGWRAYNSAQYGPHVAAEFNPAGYVVAAVDYKLSTPSTPSWPQAFSDVQTAARWVRSHARSLGINPARIAAIGESAGGQLAAMLGTVPNGSFSAKVMRPSPVSAELAAVVDFYGPADLTALVSQSPIVGPAAEQFLGATPSKNSALFAQASPLTHVSSNSAPMFIAQGDADTSVPLAQSEALAAALSAANVRHQLVVVPGAGHGFEFQPVAQDLIPKILAFLAESWKD